VLLSGPEWGSLTGTSLFRSLSAVGWRRGTNTEDEARLNSHFAEVS